MCFSLRIDRKWLDYANPQFKIYTIEYHKTAKIATKSPRLLQFFHVFHTLDAADEV